MATPVETSCEAALRMGARYLLVLRMAERAAGSAMSSSTCYRHPSTIAEGSDVAYCKQLHYLLAHYFVSIYIRIQMCFPCALCQVCAVSLHMMLQEHAKHNNGLTIVVSCTLIENLCMLIHASNLFASSLQVITSLLHSLWELAWCRVFYTLREMAWWVDVYFVGSSGQFGILLNNMGTECCASSMDYAAASLGVGLLIYFEVHNHSSKAINS